MVSCHFLSGDQREDFLGEGNHNAAREGEKTVAALAGVVAGERKTDLHDAPAQQDQTHGADQPEDEIREVVDHLNGVVGGKSGDGHSHDQRRREDDGAVRPEALFDLAGHGQPVGGLGFIQLFHCVFPPAI